MRILMVDWGAGCIPSVSGIERCEFDRGKTQLFDHAVEVRVKILEPPDSQPDCVGQVVREL